MLKLCKTIFRWAMRRLFLTRAVIVFSRNTVIIYIAAGLVTSLI